jgi:hypothetical protein
MNGLIWLEPRTQRQPEKLGKLSKNNFVLLLPEKESMEKLRFYLLCFQWSAGCPQAGDRKLCRAVGDFWRA